MPIRDPDEMEEVERRDDLSAETSVQYPMYVCTISPATILLVLGTVYDFPLYSY